MPLSHRIARSLLVTVALAASAAAAPPANSPPPLHPMHMVRLYGPDMRLLTLSPMMSTAGVAPDCGGPCNPDSALQFQYYGGKVVPNAKVYAVFWTGAVDGTTQTNIGPFYKALTNSSYLDWLTEYSTTPFSTGSHQVIGRGTFAGAYTITPATVPHTCVTLTNGATAPAGTTCIWDTDIAAELDGQINAGNLPKPDQHTVYMFDFPPSYVIQAKDRSADSCVEYCALHYAYSRAGYGTVYYGVLPDQGSQGCQQGCGSSDPFVSLTISASHELGEAITDAEAGATGTGWYDSGGTGEIGDPCWAGTDTLQGSGPMFTVQMLFSKTIWTSVTPLSSTTPACVSERFADNDFAVFFDPNTASVAAGQSISIPIHVETTNGSPSAVTLAVSSASSANGGIHATLSQSSVTSSAPGGAAVANLAIAADSGTAAAKDLVIVLNATAGSLVHSAAVLLQATAAAGATVSSNSPVCTGGTIDLSTPAVSGATYAWSGPNGFTSSQQNPTIANATSTNAGTYAVTVTANGSTSTGSTSVVVDPPPASGSYSASFVAGGATKAIAPVVLPVGNTIKANASAGFTGTLAVNPATGVVTVSNAGPAGNTFTITIVASDRCGTNATAATFPLVVNSFSDDPLTSGVTVIKATQLAELRSAVKRAAALAGQNPAFTDDPLPANAPIKAAHIIQLRAALTNAFNALHLAVPPFTDPTITPGVTAVKAAHVQELRNLLK